MKYLVFSDTHGHVDFLDHWLESHSGAVDGLVSAGDFYRDGQTLATRWNLPYYGAQGNNDREPEAPWQTIWTAHGMRFGVIHSHQWPAAERLGKLQQWARDADCQVVIFGHSHVRVYHPGTVTLLNPGALFRPRDNQPRTCALLSISRSGALGLDWIYEDHDQ